MRLLGRRRAVGLIAGAGTTWAARRESIAAASPPPFYSHGGQYTMLRPAMPAPSEPIVTAGGCTVDFTALRGKVVLLNFWATWCVPCVYEMPSLDRLQAADANKRVHVLPIALDVGGKAAVIAFYHRLGLLHLDVCVDPEQQIGYLQSDNPRHAPFQLYALPVTYAIDPRGVVRGYVPGAATWDSPSAAALIDYLVPG
jgi:thiol-disulfide isomerase/thioredoxin